MKKIDKLEYIINRDGIDYLIPPTLLEVVQKLNELIEAINRLQK